eukprot:gene2042-10751_t
MTGGVNCILFGTQFNIVAPMERVKGRLQGQYGSSRGGAGGYR